ncbi:hypothetical protein Q8A67_004827 [Cirrhinus molitorella]|uniref:Uncharacterized protein n=1 Tax=Cirrhinus molitorella TaxID=172907 RepID=A0AA88Q143_9TELE|nr:hypothetical protein Q8A67_004827 [Cirrhinus molitorella]
MLYKLCERGPTGCWECLSDSPGLLYQHPDEHTALGTERKKPDAPPCSRECRKICLHGD